MSITNNVTLVGHLYNDPKIEGVDDKKTAAFVVSTKTTWTNAKHEHVESTEHVRILVTHPRLAEIAEKHLTRGRQIAICGQLTSTKYRDNTGKLFQTTHVVANDLIMLGGKTNVSN